MSTSKPTSPLISADALEARLGDRDLKIVDVRGAWATPPQVDRDEYETSHIPGAVFAEWSTIFNDTDGPLNLAPVAGYEQAKQSFAKLGINAGDTVVIYDNYHHMMAGRIWWSMRYWGFADAKILNGSWPHWERSGRPVTNEVTVPTAGTFEPVAQDNVRTSLKALIGSKDRACLLDGRGAEGYSGKADDPKSGHIPGSLNVPFRSLIDAETGLFLEDQALEAIFDAAAADWRDTQIITTCGAGYAATVLFAALEHLGASASLFDGSFAEWKQDPKRPIAQNL